MASDQDGDPGNDPKPDAGLQGSKPSGERRGGGGQDGGKGGAVGSGADETVPPAGSEAGGTGGNEAAADAPQARKSGKRGPATRATIAARARAAERSDPRTGTHKVAGRRKAPTPDETPDTGSGAASDADEDEVDPVSQVDAPETGEMQGIEVASVASPGRASEADAPESGSMTGGDESEDGVPVDEDPPHESQVDAPESTEMTREWDEDRRPDQPDHPSGDGAPHVSETEAPESGSMTGGDRPEDGVPVKTDPPHESQVDAPESTEMTREGDEDRRPDQPGGDGAPHVSEADAPESGGMTEQARREKGGPDDARADAAPGAGGGARPSGTTQWSSQPDAGPLPERIAENIQRIEDLGQRLVQVLARKQARAPGIEGPGADFYAAAATGWMRLAAEQPARIIGQQVQYWGETLRHMADTQAAMMGRGPIAPAAQGDDAAAKDRRFANPLWQTNPFFAYVREQYRINADAMRRAAADLPIDSVVQRRRVDWFTRQIIDMMAPTNFLGTNPDALEKAIETEGQSLVRGLENLVADLEHGGGDLIVSLSDRNAFSVGQNIGTTPGMVVHREPLFELIQYTPTTEEVHRVPLIILPPWINKFYILDLKPQNSLIRWLVDQGYTLFVVSWKNPGAAEAQTGMDDYVSAYLSAFEKVRDLTGERQLNAVGYCIAGTTLAMTLGLLAQQGDDQVASATFLTTLTDFSDQGEFTAYLQDDFVTGIEEEVARTGYLTARLMQRTFSYLRANDLVWGPAVRHYMMGETPPAFDLLHWNSDGTNLPAKMVREYLRGLCQANLLMTEGFPVHGHKVRLADVRTPLCAVACERDHIAPWIDSWRGVSMMGSDDKTFLLAESGHIAGIINPPGRDKYGHYVAHTEEAEGTGATPAESAEHWKEGATFRRGSWWPEWAAWLGGRSGDMVPARIPEHGIEPAPGRYVREPA